MNLAYERARLNEDIKSLVDDKPFMSSPRTYFENSKEATNEKKAIYRTAFSRHRRR